MRKRGRKKIIKLKKERIVLSDILPYEIPLFFSNRYFYEFLIENKVEIIENGIRWKKNNKSQTIDTIIKLLFFNTNDRSVINEGDYNKIIFNEKKFDKLFLTVPFNYRISHKNDEFRELTVIHPINQIAVVNFYDNYKAMLLHYCNASPFSIRKPIKVAKYTFFKDRKFELNKSITTEHEIVEEFGKEYSNLKSYFAYNSNQIHRFYESYDYHRCEKKYNYLFKFDISKCFSSIYTHSITWALINKKIVKDHVGFGSYTFGDKFDNLMQKMNYNETNGIVIGPEFSRLFAEIILQQIELKVLNKLNTKENILFKTDYEIFRYVDDYFVFFNDFQVKEKIFQYFNLELLEFKLHVNENKVEFYEKPIITELTIAKQKISSLIEESIKNKIEIDENSQGEKIIFTLYVSSNNLITKFKSIVKETKVKYKNVLNYTLAILDRKTFNILKNTNKIKDEKNVDLIKVYYKLCNSILSILDFAFFIYSVSPRVNTTIKLTMVLSKIMKFINSEPMFPVECKNRISKKIYDSSSLILGKNKSSEYCQVETLYLLTTLDCLGKNYKIEEDKLLEYFRIRKNYKFSHELSYWSIISILFYIKNNDKYANLRTNLLLHIKERYEKLDKKNIRMSSELVLLLFDLLTCPYIDKTYKTEILQYFDITSQQKKIICFRKFWFTKWTNFDFEKELNTKRSQEVY